MNYLLVVDDSSVDAHLASGLLQKEFHERVKFAEDGYAAMELIRDQMPLAVITDLQMPVMNGLQLTERIRQKYPTLPVILMTAHGSEEIASAALTSGAVDFVPKLMLTHELVPAVKNVLAMAANGSRDQRLHRFLMKEALDFRFGNDLTLIPSLVSRLQETARCLQLVDETESLQLAKALTEVLRNAICHGNLELTSDELAELRYTPAMPNFIHERLELPKYRDRQVYLQADISPETGEFTIRDDGQGFDTTKLPNLMSSPSHLTSNQRRGLLLTQAFVDEIRFNDCGNEIRLTIRRQTNGAAG